MRSLTCFLIFPHLDSISLMGSSYLAWLFHFTAILHGGHFGFLHGLHFFGGHLLFGCWLVFHSYLQGLVFGFFMFFIGVVIFPPDFMVFAPALAISRFRIASFNFAVALFGSAVGVVCVFFVGA